MVLKYGVSPIFELQILPLNHNLYAFLMCKKTLIRIREFCQIVNQRANYFKITEYITEFGNSP
jgi:hypothetical protein